MAAGAAWWVTVACVLAACGHTLAGRDVTWPGCLGDSGPRTMEVVEPGETDINVNGIHLSECNFTTVNLNNLNNYPNLYAIDLRNIKVANMTVSTFELFTNLLIITMTNNSVLGKNLPITVFRNCPHLILIDFSNNDMRDTPADLLHGLAQLETLSVTGCNLLEVPSFFTSQIFPKMYYFYAYDNKISEIGPATFSNAVNLAEIYLSNNLIKHLHGDLLKPLTKITKIDLDNNKLLYIPEAFFQHKPSLNHVDLSNNQIENIPLNAFLGTNLKELYLNNNRLTHLPQNFILNLHNTGVSLNMFDFYGNPWECSYLNKLLVMVKNLKIVYDRSQFDGRQQACNIQKVTCTNNCT